MGIDIANVFMPEPVQDAVTGAIQVADLGTEKPTSARTPLTGKWKDGIGYVGTDGITLSGLIAAGDVVREWGKAPIRVAKGEAEPKITLPVIQLDEKFLKLLLGDDNVTVTDATADAGQVLVAGFDGKSSKAKAYCFSMKDENRRVRVFAPNAQITEIDDVKMVPDEVTTMSATLSLNADAAGKFVYFIFDNGVVKSA